MENAANGSPLQARQVVRLLGNFFYSNLFQHCFQPSGWPAYALFAGYAFVTLGEIAHRNHVIMEGGVARSPLCKCQDLPPLL